ncbi:MAG: heterocyst development glycosyltransferase HepC, partial [Microcoleus sp.]
MTNSTLSNSKIDSSVEQQHSDNYLPHCNLKWRQGILFVSLGLQSKQPYISAFKTEQQLIECLKQSPVRLVCLYPTLDEATLKLWADACDRANKPVFLRGNFQRTLQSQSQLQQLIDSIVAFFLLLLLSPIVLAVATSIYLYSPKPIVSQQWYLGRGGKFFRMLEVSTRIANDDARTAPLIRWMCKYNLDKLLHFL